MKAIIAPSILSSDFADLGRDCAKAVAAGADWLHVDVMDGHFVPNLTLGPVVISRLRPCVRAPLDVHLMISQPLRYVPAYAAAGSDWITFHVECEDPASRVIAAIRKEGKKAGISLKPATPVSALHRHLPKLDLALVMSVEPGFGGQSFMPAMMAKVAELKALRSAKGLHFLIGVDGGINAATAPLALAAGADMLVAGTAVFGAKDYRKAIAGLRDR